MRKLFTAPSNNFNMQQAIISMFAGDVFGRTLLGRPYRSPLPPLAVLLAFIPTAYADGPPLWEAGLGVAPLVFPDYRGSSKYRAHVLPLPYVIYRGDILRIDRQGVRGRLFETPRLRLEMSADGAVPVISDDNPRRRGMPDLDPIFELGPSLNVFLHQGELVRTRLRLPARAVMATDFRSVQHVGWKAHPQISLDIPAAVQGWNLGLSVGPLFGDRRYHGYYYGVSPTHATPSRPAYQASGGYSGAAVLLSTSRRFNRTWFGAFLRYDNLDGAVFLDSPLVETRHAVMAGMAVTWVFKQSSRHAPARWQGTDEL